MSWLPRDGRYASLALCHVIARNRYLSHRTHLPSLLAQVLWVKLGQQLVPSTVFFLSINSSTERHSRRTDPLSPILVSQHAYVFIHDLVQEAVAAADEVRAGGGKTREPGQALRRLRSWGFLQSLQVQYTAILVLLH